MTKIASKKALPGETNFLNMIFIKMSNYELTEYSIDEKIFIVQLMYRCSSLRITINLIDIISFTNEI